jgi:hypothetical protein
MQCALLVGRSLPVQQLKDTDKVPRFAEVLGLKLGAGEQAWLRASHLHRVGDRHVVGVRTSCDMATDAARRMSNFVR